MLSQIMENRAESDAESRSNSLNLNKSFIVQAPAGSGKTELLTQRYLGLLTSVDAPEQIVAITFTRKAANEMRNRILQRLASVATAQPNAAHQQKTWQLARLAMQADAKFGWGILQNPDRLRITTIDALCASLVRQMPYLSRFGGSPTVAEKAQIHYAEAARLTLDTVIGTQLANEQTRIVARALGYLDNDTAKLQQLIVDMLSLRDQWLPHVADLRTHSDADLRSELKYALTFSLRHLVERDIRLAAHVLADLQTPALMAAARYIAGLGSAEGEYLLPLLDWQQKLGRQAEDLSAWQALAQLLLKENGTGEPYKVFNKNNGLPSPADAPDKSVFALHKDSLKNACDFLRENLAAAHALAVLAQCPAPVYTATDIQAIEALVEVLILAYGFLWGVFQQAGETDFTEVSRRALLALGDEQAPSDLALKLDYELRHLLVDEFQDTNQHQIELLQKLTAGWTEADGRTLFVVGDPMQSIYRFRKADVGLFLRAKAQGVGALPLESLVLFRNYRSVPAVIEWINQAFASIFPAEADSSRGKVTYSPALCTQDNPEAQASGVFVHPIILGAEALESTGEEESSAEVSHFESEAEDGNELEAQEIVRIIEAEWQADSARNIAVLIRARSHLTALVAEIRRSKPEWRYEAVEIERLSARQPIQDLLALTRALCHRADRVHWLAVLRAPWCGLRLVDLLALAKPEVSASSGQVRQPLPTIWSLMHDASRLAALTEEGKARLLHVRAALSEALQHAGRHSLRRQVEGAWLRLGGNCCVGSASDVQDINTFFRLLDKLDAAGRFDLDRLEVDIDDLFAAPNTDQAAAKLKFMTVHKSKGLEFDTVILPGLHRKNRPNEVKLLSWEETLGENGEKLLVVAPYKLPQATDAQQEVRNGEEIRNYLNNLEKIREDQENRRVLYVAATRAIRALHLVGVAKAKLNKKSGSFELSKSSVSHGTPLSILWPTVQADFQQALVHKLARRAEIKSPLRQQDISKFVPKLQRLQQQDLPPVTPALATQMMGNTVGEFHPQQVNLAPHIGTLVHRYLELIAGQGVENWTVERLKALRPNFEKWLRQQGHDTFASASAAARVELALSNALTDKIGHWILQYRAQSASELALSQPLKGQEISHRIIDRTFVEDGVRWIIDYKTVAQEIADVDAFLAVKRVEYAGQLARYAALFVHENLPIQQAIYFVDLNRFELLNG